MQNNGSVPFVDQKTEAKPQSNSDRWSIWTWTRFWDHIHLRPPDDDEPQDWWVASTAIPLVAATTGPLANVMSIVALVGITDPRWCIALNATSLALGILGNLFFLFNFTQKVRYIIALPASIIMWLLATGILTGIISAMYVHTPPIGPDETFSQGYWSAVIAAVLYFMLCSILTINLLGYLFGHYPQHFALTDDQRTLILQTMAFVVWLAVGAAVFQRIMDISFADALYFSDVTVLTLGFGDIRAQNSVVKGLIFPYAVIGIVILALVVASISRFAREVTDDNVIKNHLRRKRVKTVERSVTISSDGEQNLDYEGHYRTSFRRRNSYIQERTGRKQLRSVVGAFLLGKKSKNEALVMREEKDRFDAMRAIQYETIRFRRWTSFAFSLIAFGIVWCAGAAVFSRLESLNYFDALYFTFCALLTIGYGDITPKSNPGRPFFVVWSLVAVPTMTILISKMSDTVMLSFNTATNWIAEFTVLPENGRYRQFVVKHRLLHNVLLRRTETKRVARGFQVGVCDNNDDAGDHHGDSGSDESERDHPPPRSISKLANQRTRSQRQLARDLSFAIRRVAQDIQSDGIKRYSYEEWVEFTQLIRFTDQGLSHSTSLELDENEYGLIQWDWIGEDSPMLAEETEPEWVLNRLTESLLRYMAASADPGRQPMDNEETEEPVLRKQLDIELQEDEFQGQNNGDGGNASSSGPSTSAAAAAAKIKTGPGTTTITFSPDTDMAHSSSSPSLSDTYRPPLRSIYYGSSCSTTRKNDSSERNTFQSPPVT